MKVIFYFSIFILIINCSIAFDKKKFCKCKVKITGRIIGGAKIDTYPWSVSLSTFKQVPEDLLDLVPEKSPLRLMAHTCMGVILNERFILTAAHCLLAFNESYKYSVGVGSNDLFELYGKRIRAEKIYIHPNYSMKEDQFKDDIALIKLKQDIPLSDHVQPACLEKDKKKDYGSNVVLIGFGSTRQTVVGNDENDSNLGPKSRYLKEVRYRDVSREWTYPECIRNTGAICLINTKEDESICHGDSGGAAHHFFDEMLITKVIGIASGSKNVIRKGDKRIYCLGDVVYTRIASYLDYIEKIIGKNYCQ